LADLIRGRRKTEAVEFASAIPAIPAIQEAEAGGTIARIATIALANPGSLKTEGPSAHPDPTPCRRSPLRPRPPTEGARAAGPRRRPLRRNRGRLRYRSGGHGLGHPRQGNVRGAHSQGPVRPARGAGDDGGMGGVGRRAGLPYGDASPHAATGSAACTCHSADRRSGIRPGTAHLSRILIRVLLMVVPAVVPISMTPLSLLFVVVPTMLLP
jgi:hypothetical protein